MNAEKPVRKRDAVKTRARILAAAQQAFSELGYARAGIREIATLADVNSAMLIRYFGSKAKLFEEALVDAIPMFEGIDLSQQTFGASLTEQFMGAAIDLRAQDMLVLSMGDPEARDICESVMLKRSVATLAAWLGPPNADARAIRMLMVSTGFLFYTRQVEIISPQTADKTGTAEWLARCLQDIIDDKIAGPNDDGKVLR